MKSFNPFSSFTGKSAHTLFDIRLDEDFIVFRGNEHESSGQILRGSVVLCLSSPLKIEDVHLRLTGTLHYGWTDSRVAQTTIPNQKIDRTNTIYTYRWPAFVGAGAPGSSSGSTTLQAGNYEWPFELQLPGNTAESLEGLRQASITYKLKATIARGKFAHDLHAYKRLRIVRTLDPSALEFVHSMSVENIWPDKIDYSIVVPQRAVVFGTSLMLETRVSPLLKGLEMGDITIKLVEYHDIASGHKGREFHNDRVVSSWTVPVSREEHWNDMIDDTGQEGWVIRTALDLPRKLGPCLQSATVHGIKIRHKLKVVVALKNPDGHTSELRATLPVTIFISPNMPLDEEGNLVRQLPQGITNELTAVAPPSYSEHVLDQLYDEIEATGLQTPMLASGMSSPAFGHSRAASSENLAAMMHSTITPAALSSRLQSMSLEQSNSAARASSTPSSAPTSAPLTRQNSDERPSGRDSPPYVDLVEISKVPSYQTAVKAPVRPLTSLPDYLAATRGTPISSPPTSAPGSPAAVHRTIDPFSLVTPVANPAPEAPPSSPPRSVLAGRRRTFSISHTSHDGGDEHRRLHVIQSRQRVA